MSFTRFVGDNGSLLQALAPGESNALLQAMRQTVDTALQAKRATIQSQFGLDATAPSSRR